MKNIKARAETSRRSISRKLIVRPRVRYWWAFLRRGHWDHQRLL